MSGRTGKRSSTYQRHRKTSPPHLLAVQINEAVKVWKEGLAKSIQDIDDGVKFGMNAFAGPFALAAGMQPQQLTDALNMLASGSSSIS